MRSVLSPVPLRLAPLALVVAVVLLAACGTESEPEPQTRGDETAGASIVNQKAVYLNIDNLMQSGQFDAAKKAIEAALAKAPNDEQLKAYLAQVEAQLAQ